MPPVAQPPTPLSSPARRRRVTAVVVLAALLLLAAAPAGTSAPAAAARGPGLTGAARTDETVAIPSGVWPLLPRPFVVRQFDPPDNPWGVGHRGVDLLGRIGQPVRASVGGRVVHASLLAGRGVVSIDHGKLRTTYEPVHPTIGPGAQVRRGQVIGRLQRNLSHCHPRVCLHWGLKRGETYLDPLLLVGLGPIRLLPLASSDEADRDTTPPPVVAGWVAPLLRWRLLFAG